MQGQRYPMGEHQCKVNHCLFGMENSDDLLEKYNLYSILIWCAS